MAGIFRFLIQQIFFVILTKINIASKILTATIILKNEIKTDDDDYDDDHAVAWSSDKFEEEGEPVMIVHFLPVIIFRSIVPMLVGIIVDIVYPIMKNRIKDWI